MNAIGQTPKLRFGVLARGETLAAWEAACIERLISSGHAEPALRLRDASPRDASSSPYPPPSRRGGSLLRLYRGLWLAPRSRALRQVPRPPTLAALPEVDGADLAAVARHELDFILRLGTCAAADDLARAARFGVWHHDHGDPAAPCFRELLRGEVTTAVSLWRSGGADGGGERLLHRGFFGTCRASWVNNVDRAHFGCADWCARACAELRLGRVPAAVAGPPWPPRTDLPERPPPRTDRPAPPPGNREFLRFLWRTGSRMVAKLWELLFHVETWNVGFTSRTVDQIVRAGRVDPETVVWCKAHARGRFVADPFAYVENGREHVLVEDLDDRGRGRIATVVPPHGPDRLELAVDIEHPYHMSYPCTFVDDGAVYCVPETYQARRVSLYRRAGGTWKLVRTLLEGLPAVDPTLFKHEGRYWLFFTLQDDGAFGNLRLYAHHAESLLGDWRPHALNPLKCDIGSSRPAGAPHVVDGALLRPAQDCSATYGGAVVMNRIVKLSPTEFEEVAACRIEPIRPGPYPDGLHTINAMQSGSVIDSKRFAFHPLAWRHNRGRLHEIFK